MIKMHVKSGKTRTTHQLWDRRSFRIITSKEETLKLKKEFNVAAQINYNLITDFCISRRTNAVHGRLRLIVIDKRRL
jgi:hypothetical protein